RLAQGPIVCEPMVERAAEAGIQIEIPERGPPQLIGVTPLLVDQTGVYRGSRFGCPAIELDSWQPAAEMGLLVAETIQRLGYFGPRGIGAMKFRSGTGRLHLGPLQDLNARYTGGGLALGFRRKLNPGWWGTWIHFSRRHLTGRALDDWLIELRKLLPADV